MLAAVIIMVIIIVFYLFIFALCRAAAKEDRWKEKWIEQRKKEDGHNWCDDECLHCE